MADNRDLQGSPEASLPTDAYSVAYRALTDHPGAVRASSTLTLADFYGRSESWIVETFRVEGSETVFIQRMAAGGSFRLVLPPEVTAVLSRQHDRATTGSRKRGARQAMATRLARGEVLGNPEALARARAAGKGKRRARRRSK